MLQSQLKKLGRKIDQVKFILLGLGVWNFIILDLELTSFSEKIISTCLSVIYLFCALNSKNIKSTLIMLLITVLAGNGLLIYFDFDFFVRQSIGSTVEILVILFQIKKLIELENNVEKVELNQSVLA